MYSYIIYIVNTTCAVIALSGAVMFMNKIQERKKKMRKNKLPYEDAEIEVVFFSAEDVIATSTTDNMDNNGWDGSW